MTVLALTFNPAIDQTVVLDRLTVGAVHRASHVRQDAGGKGVNVASCLADWGTPVAAYGLLGSDNAASFDALFAKKAIPDRMIRIPGSTRVNLKLVDDAATTDINLDGIAIDRECAQRIAASLQSAAQSGDLAVLSGSLPPGCPADIYATLTAALRERGVRVLLDTSGLPLACALEGAVLPDVIKPNREELADWLGRSLPDTAALLSAAHDLRRRGVCLVVISAGEDGALFVSDEGAIAAKLTLDEITSTVGAGDAMVAGIGAALAEGASLERIARLSTAFAVAKLGMAGPNLPAPAEVEALAERVAVDWLETPTTKTSMAGEAE
ncbi:1-phosphofructokinase [Novosphingobium aquimarinum]|uniref:1-phosphofructokinase n=1 Tax=Novosphingobium aquimarinum TaxID=2682494 RepID=UPI0012EB7384|nr:1-phosphofructokinase [Novosphingobium aquimarinum]